VTSLHLRHAASTERISSGIERLDTMFGGEGYFRGSSILLSGTAGTGKSSIAAHLANAACARGERCLYLSMEESPDQIVRNMSSIGLDLKRFIDSDLLYFHSSRPTLFGLEMHLVTIYRLVQELQPSVVIVDPLSNLINVGSLYEVMTTLLRLVDFLKSRQITALFTVLTSSADSPDETNLGVSSLMDVWILLRNLETNGERNRGLYVLKSRGMSHSNQIREFVMTDRGVQLLDVYLGPQGMLTGSARLAQEMRDRTEARARSEEIEAMQRKLERRRLALEAQISSLRAELETDEEEVRKLLARASQREETLEGELAAIARSRQADSSGNPERG
jgi:circadian clock protein KaiC